MNKPISIIMPVYNSHDYLPEAIQSVLGQSFSDFEFIIVDDCSTDDSLKIAQEYQKRDARIKIIQHENNTGVVGALNAGLEIAQGKYIARMDADDISMPERIEKEYTFLESHPEVDVVSSAVNVIDIHGQLISHFQMPQTQIMIEWAFCFFDPIIHPAVMAKRSVFTTAGGYRNLAENKEDCFPEDYDLWVRMINETCFYNLSEPLLQLRKHEKNITIIREQSIIKNSIRVSGWYFQSLNSPKIKPSDAELLWMPVTLSNLRSKISTLIHLYRFFIRKEGITNQEKEYIQNDFVDRIRWQKNLANFGFSRLILNLYMRSIQILIRTKNLLIRT